MAATLKPKNQMKKNLIDYVREDKQAPLLFYHGYDQTIWYIYLGVHIQVFPEEVEELMKEYTLIVYRSSSFKSGSIDFAIEKK